MMKEIGFTQILWVIIYDSFRIGHAAWLMHESLFIFKNEDEKNHKKLLEYVNYGLSIMRQKNQKN